MCTHRRASTHTRTPKAHTALGCAYLQAATSATARSALTQRALRLCVLPASWRRLRGAARRTAQSTTCRWVQHAWLAVQTSTSTDHVSPAGRGSQATVMDVRAPWTKFEGLALPTVCLHAQPAAPRLFATKLLSLSVWPCATGAKRRCVCALAPLLSLRQRVLCASCGSAHINAMTAQHVHVCAQALFEVDRITTRTKQSAVLLADDEEAMDPWEGGGESSSL